MLERERERDNLGYLRGSLEYSVNVVVIKKAGGLVFFLL